MLAVPGCLPVSLAGRQPPFFSTLQNQTVWSNSESALMMETNVVKRWKELPSSSQQRHLKLLTILRQRHIIGIYLKTASMMSLVYYRVTRWPQPPTHPNTVLKCLASSWWVRVDEHDAVTPAGQWASDSGCCGTQRNKTRPCSNSEWCIT